MHDNRSAGDPTDRQAPKDGAKALSAASPFPGRLASSLLVDRTLATVAASGSADSNSLLCTYPERAERGTITPGRGTIVDPRSLPRLVDCQAWLFRYRIKIRYLCTCPPEIGRKAFEAFTFGSLDHLQSLPFSGLDMSLDGLADPVA